MDNPVFMEARLNVLASAIMHAHVELQSIVANIERNTPDELATNARLLTHLETIKSRRVALNSALDDYLYVMREELTYGR